MKKTIAILSLAVASVVGAQAADQYFDGSATNALTASKWGTTSAGPFSSAFTSGNTAVFATVNGTGSGAAGITVGGIRAEENFTYSSPSGTLATGGTVATINVFSGKKLDLGAVALSTAAGTGFIKSGTGELVITTGGSYTGGFTLNAGIMTVGGVNAMGAGGSLTINGGTLRTNTASNRDFTGKFTGGITIGGDFTIGAAANAGTGNKMTFSNNISLGTTTRTITNDSNGDTILSGIISRVSGTVGLTFGSTTGTNTGVVYLGNTANTFNGAVTINGGEVAFAADGSFGTGTSLVLDGGRATSADAAGNAVTSTWSSSRSIQIGATAGTAISVKGSAGDLTYNGVITDKASSVGAWAKQGAGILHLGGASNYSGATAINNGTLQLTAGNDRLPTGTVVSIGQVSSTNLGTFDLNGRNQQIAGLQSTSGTNAGASTNVVTSATAATLTINNSSDYVFSSGTAADSGVISGSVSLVKTGSGTQTLGGTNTYTGTTTVNGGTLRASTTGSISTSSAITVGVAGTFQYDNFGTAAGSVTVNSGGTLKGIGTVGAVTVSSGTVAPGDSPGILNTGDFSLATGTLAAELNGTSVGTSYDEVKVAGTVTLGGTLSVSLGFTPTVGDLFFIINNDGTTDTVSGTFNGLAQGASVTFGGQQFLISYTGEFGNSTFSGTGNDVVLQAVPEPSTWATVVASLGLFFVFNRGRKSRQF